MADNRLFSPPGVVAMGNAQSSRMSRPNLSMSKQHFPVKISIIKRLNDVDISSNQNPQLAALICELPVLFFLFGLPPFGATKVEILRHSGRPINRVGRSLLT